MYTKSSPDIIRHLRGLIKDHALCIDLCTAQAHRDGNRPRDQGLIKRYVGDHKLMGRELAMLLRGLGSVPEVLGEVSEGGTKGGPERMVQPAPGGLFGMMAALDGGMERDYLSMLRIRPIPVAVKDKAVLHTAFLRRLQLHIGGYAENIGARDMNRCAHPAKSGMNTLSRPRPHYMFSKENDIGAREDGSPAEDRSAVARSPKYPG